MAYEPTEWKKGDVVTSEKLNKIEGGIAAGVGVLVVGLTITDTLEEASATLDKTAGEIIAAVEAGSIVVARASGENSHADWYFSSHAVMQNGEHTGEIAVVFYSPDDTDLVAMYAATSDDYPAVSLS